LPSPLLYEINTRCWLRALTEKNRTPVTLANVPDAEFADWQKLGFTHIWLMGVWTTGPLARAEALRHSDLRNAYDLVLPGWTEADVPGSPYSIGDYKVPAALGGEAGLQAFRERLRGHGLKLMLDFVPNHLGLDHAWVKERPELFVQSPTEAPGTFMQLTSAGPLWLAHGKDPYFPAWSDVAQVDYRRPDARAAMTQLLQSVAARCDGVRCDMAMLLLNDVFAKTWERLPSTSQPPVEEFWPGAISTVKKAQPGFLFLAEAYWGLEPQLQAMGFDYTYDKTLYDRVVSRDGGGVQHHLLGLPPAATAASAHFLENHDEPRIAGILSAEEQRAAALLILGLPGMRFLYEGQLCGARAKVPVQLRRAPLEPCLPDVSAIYQQWLRLLPSTAVGQGQGELLKPSPAWADNFTAHNYVIVQWQSRPPEFDLVVVNLAPHRGQCCIKLTVPHLAAHYWSMKDLASTEQYERPEVDLQQKGLYLDLPPHGAQLFRFQPLR
jgi:glycosidase